MAYPQIIHDLIDILMRLPGVGPKTAERYALHLAHNKTIDADALITTLSSARLITRTCSVCFMIGVVDPCSLCADNLRDKTTILVVSDVPDVEAYERSGEYRGVYHILRGLINPMEDIGASALTLNQLTHRVTQTHVSEIILGFDPTVEGEVTARYIIKLLESTNVHITRIARGLPMGSNVAYADDATLSHALRDRKRMDKKMSPVGLSQ